jgi:hypothetical protein
MGMKFHLRMVETTSLGWNYLPRLKLLTQVETSYLGWNYWPRLKLLTQVRN